jgi:hypothetical protein
MSGVLERMVQRTRATRSGIEPLLQPRYAPQRATGRRSSKMDEMDSLTEADEFSSPESGAATSHSGAWPASPADRRTLSVSEATPSGDRLPQRESLPTTPLDLQAPVSRDAGSEPLPETQINQLGPGSPSAAAKPLLGMQAEQRRFSSRNWATEPLPETPIRQRSSSSRNPAVELSRQSAPLGTGPGNAGQRFVSARLASAAGAASSSEHAADSDASNKSANEEMVKTQRAKVAPATLPLSQNKSYLRQQQQIVPHLDARSEETNTIVTISIGHIEIRAPQGAETPLRPRFRPRVSLNEFLNQRNRERG